ncbi:ferritin-like domain-containing protein [Geodermatophilus sp. CPCC 205761]|uniref:ferritin-like domain-containing protein n=1 Tax=Geodermatophilus sp. CPCC 205761 TaxID=2936597 RepID=UPI003EF07FAC
MAERCAIRCETREELVSLLYEAAELEHGLCCSYLFAAFSLRTGADAGLPEDQRESVARWRGLLAGVAREEMLHLALVSNLLTALGAAPHMGRPPFPQQSRYYPAGITIALRRFDEATLTRFVHLERPEGVGIEDDVDEDPALAPSAPGAGAPPGAVRAGDGDGEPVPGDGGLTTVGELYQAIEDGFEHLVDLRGEVAVFIGAPGAQSAADDLGFEDLVPVTDLSSARQALRLLVEQGEGVRGNWEDAHYGTFLRMREELREAQRADPAFDPAWPVVADPVAKARPDVEHGVVVDDELTVAVMDLFNSAYVLMTNLLERYLAHTDESPEALRALAGAAVAVMTSVVSPLGSLVATLPVGGEHAGATAGPSFEIHRAVALAPHRRAAWLTFLERLGELADAAARIADRGAPQAVRGVADALREIRADLQRHG